jgi:hypothetical protein
VPEPAREDRPRRLWRVERPREVQPDAPDEEPRAVRSQRDHGAEDAAVLTDDRQYARTRRRATTTRSLEGGGRLIFVFSGAASSIQMPPGTTGRIPSHLPRFPSPPSHERELDPMREGFCVDHRPPVHVGEGSPRPDLTAHDRWLDERAARRGGRERDADCILERREEPRA